MTGPRYSDGMAHLIPTSELTQDNVPFLTERDEMVSFALSFDGYGYAGGPDKTVEYLKSLPYKPCGRPDLEKWSVDDVRFDLFMEQRAAKAAGETDHLAMHSFVNHAVVVVAYLRHRLFDEPAPCGCTGEVMGHEDEKWCGRDISEAPGWLKASERLGQELARRTGIDGERFSFKVTTHCFNRPKCVELIVNGLLTEQRENVRKEFGALLKRQDSWIQKLRAGAYFEMKV